MVAVAIHTEPNDQVNRPAATEAREKECQHPRGRLNAWLGHITRCSFTASSKAGQNPPQHVRSTEGVGVIALGDGTFLLVGKDLLSHVVDHHGTFEVGYGWISAVLLSDE